MMHRNEKWWKNIVNISEDEILPLLLGTEYISDQIVTYSKRNIGEYSIRHKQKNVQLK